MPFIDIDIKTPFSIFQTFKDAITGVMTFLDDRFDTIDVSPDHTMVTWNRFFSGNSNVSGIGTDLMVSGVMFTGGTFTSLTYNAGSGGPSAVISNLNIDAVVLQGLIDDINAGGSDNLVNKLFDNHRQKINGSDGDDILRGGHKADIIKGNAGNDHLVASKGDDTILGGPGTDFLDYSDDSILGNPDLGKLGGVTIDLGAGTAAIGSFHQVVHGVEDLALTDSADNCTGNNVRNVIFGGGGDDTIRGAGGNDELTGGGGNDLLYGNSGNDLIYGNDDNDTIFGNGGNDDLFGDANEDSILGGSGDDVIVGGSGRDSLKGGSGKDTIIGDTGHDTIDGGSGNNSIEGDSNLAMISRGNDSIAGGGGNDTIFGNGGNDTIGGGSGDDSIHGDSGADSIAGGSGNDTIFGNSGKDTISGGPGDNSIHGDYGDDTINGGDDRDTIDGDAGKDTIRGNAGNDVLYGNANSDDIVGGRGRDIIRGGNGADYIEGGPLKHDGGDTISGGAKADSIYGGAGDDLLTGNKGDDELHGEQGKDTLIGGKGMDTLEGGKGNDHLTGSGDADTFQFNAARLQGFDTIDDLTVDDNIKLFNQILALVDIDQSGGDAFVTYGGGQIITLQGVESFALDEVTGRRGRVDPLRAAARLRRADRLVARICNLCRDPVFWRVATERRRRRDRRFVHHHDRQELTLRHCLGSPLGRSRSRSGTASSNGTRLKGDRHAETFPGRPGRHQAGLLLFRNGKLKTIARILDPLGVARRDGTR